MGALLLLCLSLATHHVAAAAGSDGNVPFWDQPPAVKGSFTASISFALHSHWGEARDIPRDQPVTDERPPDHLTLIASFDGGRMVRLAWGRAEAVGFPEDPVKEDFVHRDGPGWGLTYRRDAETTVRWIPGQEQRGMMVADDADGQMRFDWTTPPPLDLLTGRLWVAEGRQFREVIEWLEAAGMHFERVAGGRDVLPGEALWRASGAHGTIEIWGRPDQQIPRRVLWRIEADEQLHGTPLRENATQRSAYPGQTPVSFRMEFEVTRFEEVDGWMLPAEGVTEVEWRLADGPVEMELVRFTWDATYARETLVPVADELAAWIPDGTPVTRFGPQSAIREVWEDGRVVTAVPSRAIAAIDEAVSAAGPVSGRTIPTVVALGAFVLLVLLAAGASRWSRLRGVKST